MSGDCGLIRVLVVDDHALLREGVSSMVSRESDIELVGEAANGVEAIEAARAKRPDIVLLDLQMPIVGGIEAMEEIKKVSPTSRVIVLTTYDGDVQAVRALKAGAQGYLLKTSIRKELIDAIRAVHAGRRYILAEMAQEIAGHAADEALSQREVSILALVAAGKANKVIARELGLSEDTIKAHLSSLFAKLGVNDRTQAVTVGLKRGIITL